MLADGIEKTIRDAGLPWTTHRFWPRSGVTFAPAMPRNALEAYAAKDILLSVTLRVYLANRGVWEAIVGAGPTCPVPATDEDVERYLGAFGSFIAGTDGLGPANAASGSLWHREPIREGIRDAPPPSVARSRSHRRGIDRDRGARVRGTGSRRGPWRTSRSWC